MTNNIIRTIGLLAGGRHGRSAKYCLVALASAAMAVAAVLSLFSALAARPAALTLVILSLLGYLFYLEQEKWSPRFVSRLVGLLMDIGIPVVLLFIFLSAVNYMHQLGYSAGAMLAVVVVLTVAMAVIVSFTALSGKSMSKREGD